MSEPIGPGDLVECIKSRTGENTGKIFTVTAVRPWVGCTGCQRGRESGHAVLHLREMPLRHGASGWCIHAFRPISRRSDFESVLETLKTPRDDVDAEPACPLVVAS